MTKRQYPQKPAVAVAGIVFQDGRILIVRRGREPSKGLWTLPGGNLKIGESIRDGLVREILEETGLIVTVNTLVEVVESIHYDTSDEVQYHYVILDYLCTIEKGRLRPASDIEDCQFIEHEKLVEFQLAGTTREVIEKALTMRKGIS